MNPADMLEGIHDAAVRIAMALHEAKARDWARQASLLVDLIVQFREDLHERDRRF